jgi:hypothetical protein
MTGRDQLVRKVQALCAGLHIHATDLHQVLAEAQRAGLPPDVVAAAAREAAAGRVLRLRCGHALEGLRTVGAAGSLCRACVTAWGQP